jgi:prepilin-type N-terminal cleavage/methylation domain-containing protein
MLFRSKMRGESCGRTKLKDASGFSLIELTIAMTILLIMLAGASRLLMSSLGSRTRENQKTDALSDAQRALNIMSREISNSGFGLDFNGLVAADCHPSSNGDQMSPQIRFRSNVINSDTTTLQADEDVTYVYQPAPVSTIVRYDKNTNTRTVLADQISSLEISYVNDAGAISALATPTAVTTAVRVRLTVKVNLQPLPGQTASQVSQVSLTSDIALRNGQATLSIFNKYGVRNFWVLSSGGHEWKNWRRYLHQTAQIMFPGDAR